MKHELIGVGYPFKVSYSSHPKADAEEWYVLIDAQSEQDAIQDMNRRYHSSVEERNSSYSFHSVSYEEIEGNPLLLKAGEDTPLS